MATTNSHGSGGLQIDQTQNNGRFRTLVLLFWRRSGLGWKICAWILLKQALDNFRGRRLADRNVFGDLAFPSIK